MTLHEQVQDILFLNGIALTAVKDMILGEGAADRANKTLCRAVKRLQAKARGRAETIRRDESALDEYEKFMDRQSEMIRELGNPEVLEMHYTPGKLDVEMRSKLVSMLAGTMAELLDGEGAGNLIEWGFSNPEKGPMTLTLQRQFGKTPMQLYAEAKRELKAAAVESERLRKALLCETCEGRGYTTREGGWGSEIREACEDCQAAQIRRQDTDPPVADQTSIL
jgi:hypothetical protein